MSGRKIIKAMETEGVPLPKSNVTEILKLNDDCILEIFSYLAVLDRKTLMRVCKRFRATRDLVIPVKKFSLSNGTASIDNGIEFSVTLPIFKSVLESFGKTLISIEFCTVYSNFGSITEVLTLVKRFCPNLRELYILNFRITISAAKFMADNFENIEKFAFGECWNGCEEFLSKFFSKNKGLKYIRLQNYHLSGSCLFSLPESIETIFLRGCYNLSNGNLANALKKCVNLKKLMIVDQHDIYQYIDIISNCIPNKESLKVLELLPYDLRVETDPFLMDLNFYFVCSISDTVRSISDFVNLHELNLEGPSTINDDNLILIAKYCQQLQFVHFSCSTIVTDGGLIGFCRLVCLKVLDLYKLPRITDKIMKYMQQLNTLKLNNCYGIGNKGLKILMHSSKNLQYLEVIDCDQVIISTLLDDAKNAKENGGNDVILKINPIQISLTRV